jgi:hypothetical protein
VKHDQDIDASNHNPDAMPGERKLPLWAIVKSIAAAAFGVQSNRNQERDFTQGNYRHFIIGGIAFTVLFVLAVATVVSLVLQGAGKH